MLNKIAVSYTKIGEEEKFIYVGDSRTAKVLDEKFLLNFTSVGII